MLVPNVPLVAPEIWRICKDSDGKIVLADITTPANMAGWQHILLERIINDGTGRVAVTLTVHPSGVTQVLDPYHSTCALFNTPAAAFQYLQGNDTWSDSGVVFEF